jgi:hypothetical protein
MMEKNIEDGLSPANVTHSEFRRDSISVNFGAAKTEIGEIVGIEVTDEQNLRVLRKIDRW